MDNEWKKESFISSFLNQFVKIFSLVILSYSFVGIILSQFDFEIQILSSIFAVEGSLPYVIIFQAAGFALIMAFFAVFLFSEKVKEKLSHVLRSLLFLLATFICTSIFSVLFKWFPADSILAWIAFILSFLIFYFAAIGLSLLLLKYEDKKYNKLLENFKNKYKED